MRETTERPEGVQAGAVKLIGTLRERIVSEALLITDPLARAAMVIEKNPYGDGHAAERIVDSLEACP